MHQLTGRLREQARSHRGLGWGLRSRVYADQMWELACLRKRCVSRQMHQLTGRLREQARSHRGLGSGLRSRVYEDQRWEQLLAHLLQRVAQ
ncbi:hypothetical protein C9382_08730 [Pseudomonas aylmerensis]|uniref:Uncharacterized protein n=1 Tax=Pseudomonas aylmerensis TaxID=1869229 RepID=A0A2T4G4W3_9PSED|nr:hypothetical protein C9382_08730 [Pseudomonas aylmerensis]